MTMPRHQPSLRAAACLLSAASLCAALALPAGAAERGLPRKAVTAQPVETEARVIVKFKADSSMARALAASAGSARVLQAQPLSARLGLVMRDGRVLTAHSQVLKASGVSSRELAARLSALPEVEYAEVDERMRAFATVPNDPFYLSAASPAAGQWYLRTPNATIVSAVNAEAAWAITTGKSSVVVAVLDTGVRKDHPDLAGKLLAGYDFVGGLGTADAIFTANDNNARDADPSDPGDGVTAADVGIAGCTAADEGPSSWHGTQTSGIVGAATNNGIGMAGIGRDVMVLPVRVLGKCGGYSSDIQAAMRWSAGLTSEGGVTNPTPAKVINLSLGSATTTCSASYQSAVDDVIAAGVVVVAAAGNDGLAVGTPANCNGVIGVAGVRQTGTKVGYSNLGPSIAISAPAGNCVNSSGACLYPLLTTGNNGAQGPGANIYTDGQNQLTLGTSFSSPLVAGTVALMLSAAPSLNPAQVLVALKSTARAFPSTGAGVGVTACTAPTATAQDSECYCTTTTCGAGLLDAGAAVAAVAVVTANISVASSAIVIGTPVTLDGSSSKASGTGSITSYAWAITSGSASFSSATNASTATLSASAAGNVVVSLTVTDSSGRQATTSTTLTASTPTPPPASGGGDGGGGGALNLEWLGTLVASTLALHLAARRQRRLAATGTRAQRRA